MKNLLLIVKGLLMGTADVIPGVSGGTIALILGIYEELVNAIKTVNLKFLVPLGIGIAGALLFFARLLPYLMDKYPSEASSFLLGLILASANVPYSQMEKKGGVEIIFGVGGFALAFIVVKLTHLNTTPSFAFIFLCGFASICAMILPGISGAFILVLLGQYDTMLKALRDMNFGLLVPFALGAGVGLTSFVHLLSFLLYRFHSPVMAALMGLMLGSLRGLLPKEVRFSVGVCFLLGIGLVLSLRHLEKKRKELI